MKKGFLTIIICLVLSVPVCAESDDTDTLTLPVVMYHHITKIPSRCNDYVVSLEEFERDIDYLSSNGWQTVGIDELIAWSRGELELPEKAFMLTFDDGFESTLAYAEPVLRSHGYTGVLAVIGSVCEKFSECGEHDAELSNLSWEDTAGMARRGTFNIICHTWDMHTLSRRPGCSKRRGESSEQYKAALRQDLGRFIDECEKNSVALKPAIAYPYGSFCSETLEIIEEMGFAAAFTCDEAVNHLQREPSSLMRIARFNRAHGSSSEKFFQKWEEAVDKECSV